MNVLQVKLQRASRLESVVLEFCLEIMDYIDKIEISETKDIERRKRKELLVANMEYDPVAVITSLRTQVRTYFAKLTVDESRKDEHFTMFKAAQKELVDRLQKEKKDVTTLYDEMKQEIQSFADKINQSEGEVIRLNQLYNRKIDDLNIDMVKLKKELDFQTEQAGMYQDQIQKLKEENDRLQQVQKERERGLAVSPSCSTAANKFRSVVELVKKRNQVDKLSESSRKDSLVILPESDVTNEQIMKLNDKLQRQLNDARAKCFGLTLMTGKLRKEQEVNKRQIVDLRKNASVQAHAKLEKETRRLRDSLHAMAIKHNEEQAELLRTKGILKERDILIERMKVEYNNVFISLQKIKNQPTAKASRIGQAKIYAANVHSADTKDHMELGDSTPWKNRDILKNHPTIIELYKKKIEQLEQNIRELQVKLQKTIVSEYIVKQQNRSMRHDKHNLISTCNQLRGELDESVHAAAKTVIHAQRQLQGSQPLASMSILDKYYTIDEPRNPAIHDSEIENSRHSCIEHSKSLCNLNVKGPEPILQRNSSIELISHNMNTLYQEGGITTGILLEQNTRINRPKSALGIIRSHK